jgi:hypothetical protein
MSLLELLSPTLLGRLGVAGRAGLLRCPTSHCHNKARGSQTQPSAGNGGVQHKTCGPNCCMLFIAGSEAGQGCGHIIMTPAVPIPKRCVSLEAAANRIQGDGHAVDLEASAGWPIGPPPYGHRFRPVRGVLCSEPSQTSRLSGEQEACSLV